MAKLELKLGQKKRVYLHPGSSAADEDFVMETLLVCPSEALRLFSWRFCFADSPLLLSKEGIDTKPFSFVAN